MSWNATMRSMRGVHPDWIVPDWPAPADVRAFVTTRAGGVSEGAYATMNLSASASAAVHTSTAVRVEPVTPID